MNAFKLSRAKIMPLIFSMVFLLISKNKYPAIMILIKFLAFKIVVKVCLLKFLAFKIVFKVYLLEFNLKLIKLKMRCC